MESASCFFAAASAVYVLSLLWALREGRGTRVWLAVVLVGASLYQILPPALHGILLLACSLVLIGATRRAVQLLPVKSRAVLITGEACWLFCLNPHHVRPVLADGGCRFSPADTQRFHTGRTRRNAGGPHFGLGLNVHTKLSLRCSPDQRTNQEVNLCL